MTKLPGKDIPLIDDANPAIKLSSRLALAIVMAALGLLAVSLLEPVLTRPYYFPAIAAVIVAAVVAGTRYGCLTTVLFGAGYVYWFLAPRHALGVKSPHEEVAVVAYTVTGFFVAGIGGALRRAYADLRAQHRLLDRTVAQREDLLHAMAHDIRSPLNVITMNADLLARKLGEVNPAERRRALLIKSAVVAIESMLRDLIKVVELESGQVRLQPVPVQLESVLHRLTDGLAGTLPIDRVNVALPNDLPPLRADPARFERILVNLISNALKYSPGAVTITAQHRENEVVVSVRDDGPGISPSDLPHVFDKYFRSDGAQSRDGLGLGLYISRLLVEAHGGRIWAVSTPGEGSTFHVALPTSSERARIDAAIP